MRKRTLLCLALLSLFYGNVAMARVAQTTTEIEAELDALLEETEEQAPEEVEPEVPAVPTDEEISNNIKKLEKDLTPSTMSTAKVRKANNAIKEVTSMMKDKLVGLGTRDAFYDFIKTAWENTVGVAKFDVDAQEDLFKTAKEYKDDFTTSQERKIEDWAQDFAKASAVEAPGLDQVSDDNLEKIEDMLGKKTTFVEAANYLAKYLTQKSKIKNLKKDFRKALEECQKQFTKGNYKDKKEAQKTALEVFTNALKVKDEFKKTNRDEIVEYIINVIEKLLDEEEFFVKATELLADTIDETNLKNISKLKDEFFNAIKTCYTQYKSKKYPSKDKSKATKALKAVLKNANKSKTLKKFKSSDQKDLKKWKKEIK
jgi:hypothetical protein